MPGERGAVPRVRAAAACRRTNPRRRTACLARAHQALGTTKDLQLELAQTRAAQGQWVESAQRVASGAAHGGLSRAGRGVRARADAVGVAHAQVREVFLALPVEVPSRRALAELETSGARRPTDGTRSRICRPTASAADAWSEFAKRAESEDRWMIARDALESALRWKRTPELAIRAATAAMNAGDAPAALRLAPLADAHGDSALVARTYLPLHARALAALGRPAEAERLVELRSISPARRAQLADAHDRVGLGAHRRHGARARRARRHRCRRRFERRGGLARAL